MKRDRQNGKMGHGGKGGGEAVWRFHFLPFARKATPCLTLTFFDFRLAKKGRAFALPDSVTLYGFAPSHGRLASPNPARILLQGTPTFWRLCSHSESLRPARKLSTMCQCFRYTTQANRITVYKYRKSAGRCQSCSSRHPASHERKRDTKRWSFPFQ